MADESYSRLLRAVIAGEDLSRRQTHRAFTEIMDGRWDEVQIAALLAALAAKGETVDEIAGGASAMREHVVRSDTGGAETIDTCGTGGTGLSTLNVSTAAAMVLAGAGLIIARRVAGRDMTADVQYFHSRGAGSCRRGREGGQARQPHHHARKRVGRRAGCTGGQPGRRGGCRG